MWPGNVWKMVDPERRKRMVVVLVVRWLSATLVKPTPVYPEIWCGYGRMLICAGNEAPPRMRRSVQAPKPGKLRPELGAAAGCVWWFGDGQWDYLNPFLCRSSSENGRSGPGGRLVVLLAVAIWARHNHKVSTSVFGPYGSYALDGSGVWLTWLGRRIKNNVLVETVTESVLVVLVVLAAQLLGLALQEGRTTGRRRRRPGRIVSGDRPTTTGDTTTRGSSSSSNSGVHHPREQQLVAVPGVLWAEGGGKRVGNKLVFTFTSRGRGRQRAGDRLLARLGRAGPRGPAVLLVVRRGRRQGAVAGLGGNGAPLGDSGGRGRGPVVALEAGLHLADPLLEGLELGRLRLDGVLSVGVGENANLSARPSRFVCFFVCSLCGG